MYWWNSFLICSGNIIKLTKVLTRNVLGHFQSCGDLPSFTCFVETPFVFYSEFSVCVFLESVDGKHCPSTAYGVLRLETERCMDARVFLSFLCMVSHLTENSYTRPSKCRVILQNVHYMSWNSVYTSNFYHSHLL